MNRIAVISIGLCTPLGANAAVSISEMASGELPFVEVDTLGELETDSETVTVNALPGTKIAKSPLVKGSTQVERIAGLLKYAFDDCGHALAPVRGFPAPLFLAVPEALPATFYPPLDSPWVSSLELTRGGRASFFQCLQSAIQALTHRERMIVFVGAADTNVDTVTLLELLRRGRAVQSTRPAGIIPSEGAGVLALTLEEHLVELKASPCGWLSGVALDREPNHFQSGRPNLADGLTRAFRQLLTGRSNKQRIDEVLSCQTGEHFFTREWAFTSLRHGKSLPEPLRMNSIASALGEPGAAGAVIQAARALYRPRFAARPFDRQGSLRLVYASADDGAIGASLWELA